MGGAATEEVAARERQRKSRGLCQEANCASTPCVVQVGSRGDAEAEDDDVPDIGDLEIDDDEADEVRMQVCRRAWP